MGEVGLWLVAQAQTAAFVLLREMTPGVWMMGAGAFVLKLGIESGCRHLVALVVFGRG